MRTGSPALERSESAERNVGPSFSGRDIKLIAASLGGRADPRRLDLLPKILREWSRTDLRKHLSSEPRAFVKEKRKRFEKVGKRARDLLQTLDALDEHEQFGIAFAMALAHGHTWLSVSQTELTTLDTRLSDERNFLSKLAEAARKATRKRGRGQPRNNRAYLILQDAATIFEWLTCRTASRAVDCEIARNSDPLRGGFRVQF